MNARDRRAVAQFFARVETRIASETALANAPGIRRTARTAAADRARTFASDLDYLRDRYGVAAGQGGAR